MIEISDSDSSGFQLHRFDGALGAEIIGLDLSQPLTDRTIAEIRTSLLECGGLLVFRSQIFTPEQHVAFSRRFGPLMIHVLQQFLLPGHPEILRVSNIVENGRPIGLGDAGSIWHSDLSYTPEPSLGSLLHALELPAEGGDTSFANMTAAYDALPEDIRHRLDGKSAVHSYVHGYEQYGGSRWRPALTQQQKAEVPEVIHPVVRIHPETGRKALFVNEAFTSRILDVSDIESRELLDFLFPHCAQSRFVYRHEWQDRDLIFWDNRCTIHKAHGCPAELRRHMHRTTIKGDAPR
ncbi:MAG TPA: TauD/TfdA family dioxygenase [Rhizomicrobium sp.]|jgi:taurine dioxygenase|nr:TauD/TfdA family dioxygenase [Rhizomicrobium sp.]